MIYHQKDIVEIDFPIPGEGYKVHPALIVSNDKLYSNNINNYKTMKKAILSRARGIGDAGSDGRAHDGLHI